MADALGMIPDQITQSVEPVIAEGNVESKHVRAKSGEVSGMRQVACCLSNGKECVSLEVLFCVGATEPQD